MAEINANTRRIIAGAMGKTLPPLADVTLSYGNLFDASGSYIYYQQFAAIIHLLQLFVVTCMIYVMAAQSIGLLLFTFTSSTIAYSLIGILVSIALTFSDTAVPELSMPLPARIIANLQPLTHALYAMFDVFLRQVQASAIFSVCVLLMVYPLVAALLVRNRLMTRLLKEGDAG